MEQQQENKQEHQHEHCHEHSHSLRHYWHKLTRRRRYNYNRAYFNSRNRRFESYLGCMIILIIALVAAVTLILLSDTGLFQGQGNGGTYSTAICRLAGIL